MQNFNQRNSYKCGFFRFRATPDDFLVIVCILAKYKIYTQSMQLVMWFIFNLKSNKKKKPLPLATHLEQAWTRVPHFQACDSSKLSHVYGMLPLDLVWGKLAGLSRYLCKPPNTT
jgi:hypothetical protein